MRLGIAGSHGAGLMEFAKRRSDDQEAAPRESGRSRGSRARCWPRRDSRGPSTVLEGERGFLNVFSPTPDATQLTKDLGNRVVTIRHKLQELRLPHVLSSHYR